MLAASRCADRCSQLRLRQLWTAQPEPVWLQQRSDAKLRFGSRLWSTPSHAAGGFSGPQHSDGQPVEMPSKLMSHQAEVRFMHGLPYRLTHDVLRKMIKQGMLPVDDGRNKQLGELKIVGFYLEDLGDQISRSEDEEPPAGWSIAATAVGSSDCRG
eukprot:Skav215546  [mRNA]  locus=scaffold3091:91065:94772:+ [translate_table: standard]